ncbi:peptidase M50 [Gemmatirosa kalamazoonensis]|uniref:Peptidase M50 n=1 Tax=Gemmatirosa kalamazoonensis TaxID=861299 RepID=W0RHY0_9BACT|nr:site-2 protease family protein [Gemmatirosa kalamazoonensis]AHG89018.1 peptidase M50 [Gemmatirosa kalamazoonensis]
MPADRCASCGTELAPHALACPACDALVHGPRLQRLAEEADAATAAGDVTTARARWEAALRLLPEDSRQHALVRARVASLDASPDASPDAPTPRADETPWWRRGAGGLLALVLLLLGKLKFLLLGLTKASTFLSMFGFFALYWSLYGWPLALGLVVSIYIHEMGHVAMLRRLGIAAGAPLFIPGVGALVLLKQRVDDPVQDAQIGLAGPVWGLGAGLAALAVYGTTHTPVWLAIAQLTGFLNLFNLIPFWQLDGSRGFHALSRSERWIVVAAIAIALLWTEQRILFLVGGVAVWRAMQREAGPGDRRVLATFVVLVMALAWLARTVR